MERGVEEELERAAAEVIAASKAYRADIERLFRGEGTTEAVFRWIDPSFQAYYGIPHRWEGLVPFSEAQEKEGFIAAAKTYGALGGAAMTIPWMRSIARTPDEVMIAYEICQVGPQFWDRALVLEIWRRAEDGGWRVVRQTMEQEGRTKPAAEQPRSPVPTMTIA